MVSEVVADKALFQQFQDQQLQRACLAGDSLPANAAMHVFVHHIFTLQLNQAGVLL